MKKRVFLIVLDSFGIGEMPDSDRYGDLGANTLKSVMKSKFFKAECLKKLGLFNIDGVNTEKVKAPIGAYGRLSELSKGKDTTTGHWEMCGIVSEKPMPTYPNGFPNEIIEEFSKKTDRGVLCNMPYSGTEVIKDYGEEHIKSGKLIVYTSADSVFQVAAHEDIVPVEKLYEYCSIARDMLKGEHGVGRVIARPFKGTVGNFYRTENRHDFSLAPPFGTLLDIISDHGLDVIGIGKINDIFSGQGITKAVRTKSNKEGMERTMEYADRDFSGLCFVNLVDFDMLYGHRNDVDGYAQAISEFDRWLFDFMQKLKEDDLLIITADHGCDPGLLASTDHTREYVPILKFGKGIKPENLGTLSGFANVGKAVYEQLFGKRWEALYSFCSANAEHRELTDEELVKMAIASMENSYAPYSGFKVGSALLGKSGKVYCGCNVESCAFTPTSCAERTAIFKAVSEGEREFTKIAVVGCGNGKITEAVYPCGVCRQVLLEFCDKDMPVITLSDKGIESSTLGELLPKGFNLNI